jgi:3-deoxy-manno-octulosonate cytidylyltransferase (CMP-KDO synthetase)
MTNLVVYFDGICLPSGTDRIFAATKDLECDVIVNIQGDEPLVTGDLIDSLSALFIADPSLDMGTLAHPISQAELDSKNSVKVVVNRQDEALYFSRYPIPYSRASAPAVGDIEGCLKHIGMYAYKKSFLKKFCDQQPVVIEVGESLEQLRALYLGAKIKILRVQEAAQGVDTPEDLAKLEKIMRGK